MAKKYEKNRNEVRKRKPGTDTGKSDRMWLLSVIILMTVLLAVFLWKFSGVGKTPSDTIVFRVGEEEVYLDEVNFCILQNVANLGIDEDALNTTADDGSSADTYYKQEILQLITDYKVEAQIAQKQGITLTDKEKESVRKDAVEYLGKIDGRILTELGISQERVEDIYAQRYLAHKLEDTVTADVEVEEQRYCTLYMLLFPKVQVDAEGNYLTEEDGQTPLMASDEEIETKKQEAEEAYNRLLDGEDISELAKEYGVETVSGEESNMEESFGDAFTPYAKSLKEGEYSPVIDIASCYAIVKMVKENNEELAKQVMERYKSDVEQEAVTQQRKEWYEDAGVEEAVIVGDKWEAISLYDFAKYVEE